MQRVPLSLSLAFASLTTSLVLSGCSANFGDTVKVSTQTTVHIQGEVHGGKLSLDQGAARGGQQPLVGSHVYLYAVGTSGYGGASKSLLTAFTTGDYPTTEDANGNYYVTTGAGGAFDIAGEFACTQNTWVYLYNLGGSPSGNEANNNPAAGLLAVIGSCGAGNTFPGVGFVTMNEISTIAAAYALAGFATDATHISSSGSTLAQQGVGNAFNNALNIVSQSAGTPNTTFASNSNATIPVTRINALADILAACVNASSTSTQCTSLFSNTENNSGVAPTDTATAAINIAQHPGRNVANLFSLVNTSGPFQPTPGSVNDLMLGVSFTDPSLDYPQEMAIDGSGNVWLSNLSSNGISKFSGADGKALSPSTGYTGGGLNGPSYIAIDASGNAWIANSGGNSVVELSSAGVPSTGSPYGGGGMDDPYGIAIDDSSNIWVANNSGGSITKLSSSGVPSTGSPYSGGGINPSNGSAVLAIDGASKVWAADSVLGEFSNSGSPISPSTGYTGGGIDFVSGIAIDGSGNVWTTNAGNESISKFSSSGVALSPSSGYSGGGLDVSGGPTPFAIAIDGAGNVWTANQFNSLSEFSGSTGAALSPPTGYMGNGIKYPGKIAIDGSGDVWTSDDNNNTLIEFIGAAAPVVTPVVANLVAPYGTPASKP